MCNGVEKYFRDVFEKSNNNKSRIILLDDHLWTYNKETFALINARYGTAVNNSNVNGKWIIPDASLPNIIQSAPKVLGLSLVGEQLWKYDGTHLSNTKKSFLLDFLDEQLWTYDSPSKILGKNNLI